MASWYDPTQEKGWGGYAQADTTSQLSEMYRDLLGREADTGGLNYYSQQAQSGKSLSDIARELASSSEYQSRNPTTNLGSVYQNVLERDPDKAGYQWYANQAGSGMSAADAIASFYNSDEYKYGRDPATQLQMGNGPVDKLNSFGGQSLDNSTYFTDILKGYYKDPSTFKNNPMYQAMYNQGLDAINRSAAAKGMLGSGNRMFELSQFGADNASKSWDTEANRLGSLSGMYGNLGNSSYQTAGNLYAIQNAAASNNFNNYLNALKTGITGSSGSFGNDMSYLSQLASGTNTGALGNLGLSSSLLQNLAAMLGGRTA